VQTADHTYRFSSLDEVRGFLILIMSAAHAYLLLTHTSGREIWFEQELINTDITFNILRFIGHPVAIGFAACMGMGMVLLYERLQSRTVSKVHIISFFLKRGILLLLLQFTFVNTAWRLGGGAIGWNDLTLFEVFGVFKNHTYFGVLFMLGACMIISCFFLSLSKIVLAVLGGLIAFSPSLYLTAVDNTSAISWVFGPLAVPGGWKGIWVLYSIVPWLGIVMIGMSIGKQYVEKSEKFLSFCFKTGRVLILIFVVLLVGEILLNFQQFDNPLLLSLRLTRYPPEPFLLIYGIGFFLICLWVFAQAISNILSSVLAILGQAARFFYVTHLIFYAVFAYALGPIESYLHIIAAFLFVTGVMILLCFFYKRLNIVAEKVLS